MTTTPHEVRNWLHQLLSSIEAAMPDVTAQCFSRHHPLEVVTPLPDGVYTRWQPLADILNEHLGDLMPGAVRYRLIENVTHAGDTLPAEMTLPVEIQWRVALFRKGSPTLTPLDCSATLIRDDKELAAIRLILMPPAPEPEEEAQVPAATPEPEVPPTDVAEPAVRGVEIPDSPRPPVEESGPTITAEGSLPDAPPVEETAPAEAPVIPVPDLPTEFDLSPRQGQSE